MEYTKETFPYNNWYLHFEELDREIVDNWRINIIKFSDNPCPGHYINYHGGGGARGGFRFGMNEITINQFKEFILNTPIEYNNKSNENYDYLIPILKKINNK